MYIKSTLNKDFGNFALDTSKIELHSVSKDEIHLPYRGPLPAELSDATDAVISIMVHVGLTVGVLLIVNKNGKKLRHPVEATPPEINDVLFPFFFHDKGNNAYQTRRDNGLNSYGLGLWQGSYLNWKRLVLEEHGLDNLLFQLSPAAVERVLQHVQHSDRM